MTKATNRRKGLFELTLAEGEKAVVAGKLQGWRLA